MAANDQSAPFTGDLGGDLLVAVFGLFQAIYMANAGGRLVGTLLSGSMFQVAGVAGCLWTSFALALLTALISTRLPQGSPPPLAAGLKVEAGD